MMSHWIIAPVVLPALVAGLMIAAGFFGRCAAFLALMQPAGGVA